MTNLKQKEKTRAMDSRQKVSIRRLMIILSFFLLILPATSRSATKLTIGYATVTARLMPLWIAHEQGILAKYGIDAQPILIRGAPTLVAGLASGDLHIGRTGGSAMLSAVAAGHDFKFLASWGVLGPGRGGRPPGSQKTVNPNDE